MYQALLDALPQGGILLQQNLVTHYNAAALHLLSTLSPRAKLTAGEPLPTALTALLEGEEGTLLHRGTQYQFSTQQAGEGVLLCLSKTEKKTSGSDIDQFLYRLRQGMSLSSVGLENILTVSGAERIDQVGALYKAHYSMVRALEHMELLRGERTSGTPVQLELVGYCQRLQVETAPLLRDLNATLTITPKQYSLFVQGEAWYLQRLLLGLISNSIQAGGRQIQLTLSCSSQRCKIRLTDDCVRAVADLSPEAQLRRDLLSVPDSLDLTTARALAKGLQGTILVSKTPSGGNQITIALPLSSNGALSIQSSSITAGERYSNLLVELADVLPANAFSKGDGEW